MLKELYKKLYFKRYELLFYNGLRNGDILPFEDDLYDRLSRIYFNGYPLSIQIKYLKPMKAPGNCEDRSWFITMGFEDALWVSGDNKDLKLTCGKNGAWHFWVEYNNWVYDPTLLYKFKKELYYKMFQPENIVYRIPEIYKKHEWYQDIINTKLEDLKPGGKKRFHLSVSIPLVYGIAKMSNNKNFIDELEQHLDLIQYDHKQIVDEMNKDIINIVRDRKK